MKPKRYCIASAAANLEERGQKAIWQDRLVGWVYFCDFDDLPKSACGYLELSELELLNQEESRVHF